MFYHIIWCPSIPLCVYNSGLLSFHYYVMSFAFYQNSFWKLARNKSICWETCDFLRDYFQLVHIVYINLCWSESLLLYKYYSICVKATFVMVILTLLMKRCEKWSMCLVYFYNCFIFNLFLTFSHPLKFIYVYKV